jgi:hypothetical protein
MCCLMLGETLPACCLCASVLKTKMMHGSVIVAGQEKFHDCENCGQKREYKHMAREVAVVLPKQVQHD